MPSRRHALLALAFVALASGVAATPRPASACGATFRDADPQAMPVDQRGETILFVMGDGWIEAHVQIEYEGDPARLAWLVPIMAVPEVSVGSQALLDRVLDATAPTFSLGTRFEGSCDDGRRRASPGCVTVQDIGEIDFPEEVPDSVEPNVLARDAAGVYEYAVLEGGTVEGIGQWLDDNGYARDDEAPELLQAYLDEGFLFVAFKLRAGADVDRIHPVVLRYQGTEPYIPLRLTQIAAVDDMRVRALFLGSARVAPTNYRHVELNPLRIDWFRLGTNYDFLVKEAIDLEGADGRAFVTEYAGPSTVVSQAGLLDLAWDSEAFLETTAATLGDLLAAQRLVECGAVPSVAACVSSHPLVLPLLRTYFPPPPGVSEAEFYACPDCYPVIDESTWDPAGFAAAFEEQVVGPAEHALDVLDGHGYLTRLYTMISPAEMTTDPRFHERADLPGVSNQWSATRAFHCEENDRFELADGTRIYLDDAAQPPVFTHMSAAARIEEIPLAGAPMTVFDATEDHAAELAAWNAAQSPAGCDCRASRRAHGAGWLTLLLLLGLRARAPRRASRPSCCSANRQDED